MTPANETALRTRAIKGGVTLGIGQVLKGLVQVLGLIVLARLLTPEEFGIVTMATAIVGITAVLSDFGLSMALLKFDLDRNARDQLFYINVCLAIVIATTTWLSAPAVASLYDEPQLESVTRWLALGTLLSSLTPQFRAELANQLRFGVLSYADFISQLGGLGVACIVATSGGGYWAVVAQTVSATCLLLAILSVSSRYVPRSRPTFRGVRSHVNFGRRGSLYATDQLHGHECSARRGREAARLGLTWALLQVLSTRVDPFGATRLPAYEGCDSNAVPHDQ